MERLDSFRGEWYFLSNFSRIPVEYDGICYSNGEAAFHAQKTLDNEQRRIFASLDPRDAKRLGRSVSLRSDWESIKDEIMYNICKAKLEQNCLQNKLLSTGDAELVEGNTWHDNYWGSCQCSRCSDKGRNQLGKTWMRIRDELKGKRNTDRNDA